MEVKKPGKWVLDPASPRTRAYSAPPRDSRSCDLSRKSRASSGFTRLVLATFLQRERSDDLSSESHGWWDEIKDESSESSLVDERDESSESRSLCSVLLWSAPEARGWPAECCHGVLRCTLWTRRAGGGQLTKQRFSSERGEIGQKRTSLFPGLVLTHPTFKLSYTILLVVDTYTHTHAHTCPCTYTHIAVFPLDVLNPRPGSTREISSLRSFPSPSSHHSPESESRAPHAKASEKLTFLHIRKTFNMQLPMNPTTLNSMVLFLWPFVIPTLGTEGVTLCLFWNRKQTYQICI